MKKLMSIMAVVALVSVFAVGCGAKTDSEKSDSKTDSAAKNDDDGKPVPVAFSTPAVCTACGDGVDGEHTCVKDGDKCECGFEHDSKLCCTGLKPAEGLACVNCGGAAEEGHECPEGEKCEGCGRLKGTTFCCLKRDHKH